MIPGPVADPCPERDYPVTCFNGVGDLCTCQDRTPRDRECSDQVASQGLHNYLVAMADTAVQFASTPMSELNKQNANYRFLTDYDKTEWALGLVKTILLHQHEAITGMRDNTMITISVFVFIAILAALQYLLLGIRIETLMMRVDHIARIVERLETSSTNWAAVREKQKGKPQKSYSNAGEDASDSEIEDSGSSGEDA